MKKHQRYRDIVLKELGIKVIRFKNDELKNLDDVIKRISVFLLPPLFSKERGQGVS